MKDHTMHWCICQESGQCLACEIETLVAKTFGRGALYFLRKRLAINQSTPDIQAVLIVPDEVSTLPGVG